MRVIPTCALAVVPAVSALLVPAAHAGCYGPSITATLDSDGKLVVDGEAFGTACHDAGPPPQGEGVLGPPARDITVAVRQDHVEFLVAHGDAAEDYTFHVTVDPPPMVGDVVVEARFASQEGFTSHLIAAAELTLPESAGQGGGRTVTPFGGQVADRTQDSAGAGGPTSTTVPDAGSRAEGSSTALGPAVVALLIGVLLGAVGLAGWNRRQDRAQV